MIVNGKLITYDQLEYGYSAPNGPYRARKGEILFNVPAKGNPRERFGVTAMDGGCIFRGRLVLGGDETGRIAFKIKHTVNAGALNIKMREFTGEGYDTIFYGDLDFETGEVVADVPEWICGYWYACVKYNIYHPTGEAPVGEHASDFYILTIAGTAYQELEWKLLTWWGATPIFKRVIYDESQVPTTYLKFGVGSDTVRTFTGKSVYLAGCWAGAVLFDAVDSSNAKTFYKWDGDLSQVNVAWQSADFPDGPYDPDDFEIVSYAVGSNIIGTSLRNITINWRSIATPYIYVTGSHWFNPLTGSLYGEGVGSQSGYVLLGIIDGSVYVGIGYEDTLIEIIKNPNLLNSNWYTQNDYAWKSTNPPSNWWLTGKLDGYIYSGSQRWNDSNGNYDTITYQLACNATSGEGVAFVNDPAYGKNTMRLLYSNDTVSSTIHKSGNHIYFDHGSPSTVSPVSGVGSFHRGEVYCTGTFFKMDYVCLNASDIYKYDIVPPVANKLYITNITAEKVGSVITAYFTFNRDFVLARMRCVVEGFSSLYPYTNGSLFLFDEYRSLTYVSPGLYKVTQTVSLAGYYRFYLVCANPWWLYYTDGLVFSPEDCVKKEVIYKY